jgi:hypothetical protein
VKLAAAGTWHLLLPANLEWGVSIPNPTELAVKSRRQRANLLGSRGLRDLIGCNDPGGSSVVPNGNFDRPRDFLMPDKPAGAPVMKSENGRTWFSVNDRSGNAFGDNEGYFEIDVELEKKQ